MEQLGRKIYSVSEFVQAIRDYFTQQVGMVAVQGEVTNYRESNGNLVFFELKDKESRVLCFMMKFQLKTPLEDGMEIRVLGSPALFKKSGGFHLRVVEIELVGEGALQKALLLLKDKLEKEGLFALERKRALPRFPARVGIITSPDAAAYTDVLKILKNRWSGLLIKLFPVNVQGIGSVSQIVNAFDYFNSERGADVIILTRGGGSLEDLQSFNSEEVVRAVFASKIPVVCGVGHERDVTLADYAADKRASTPSNAAEITVPSRQEILNQISWHGQTIASGILNLVEGLKESVDEKEVLIKTGVSLWRDKFDYLREKLFVNFQNYRYSLERKKEKVNERALAIKERFLVHCQNINSRIFTLEKLIKTLSPQATLERGFSLTYLADEQKIIKDVAQVKSGDVVKTRLSKGKFESKVT